MLNLLLNFKNLKSFLQIVIQSRLNRLLHLFRGLKREARVVEEGSASGKEQKNKLIVWQWIIDNSGCTVACQVRAYIW